jgi:hypothetical protein
MATKSASFRRSQAVEAQASRLQNLSPDEENHCFSNVALRSTGFTVLIRLGGSCFPVRFLWSHLETIGRSIVRPGMNSRANSENPLKRVKEVFYFFSSTLFLLFNPLWVWAISLGIHSEAVCGITRRWCSPRWESLGFRES